MVGVASAVGGGAYVLVKLRALRARLTPANVGKASALAAADLLTLFGKAIAPRSRERLPG